MKEQSTSSSPVAVIGAGPVGLAAAAHLVGRGLPVVVLEAGTSVATHLGSYRHVRLFSPWRYNVDRAARALLETTGWSAPNDDDLPTAGEVVDDYLAPLARTPALAPHIQFGARVTAVSRDGFDKAKTAGREHADFLLQVQSDKGLREVRARAVIDASGTWSQPNPLGVHGLPVLGEIEARAHIAHGMPDVLDTDRHRYVGRKVLVVGAGHSAAGNLLALARLAEQEPDTRVVWAVRGTDLRKLFGGGENDGLPARGQLGTSLRAMIEEGRLELHLGFGIREIVAQPDGMRLFAADVDKTPIEGIDEIIVSTGARPDLNITRELRLRLDPWLESTDALAPLIDPNVHSCGTVRPHGHRELMHPEPGFYAIGAKSYGRAPSFLMATGYEQARSVVAALAGDLRAADDVQLELPETGVCSVNLASPDLTAGNASCCGGPAKFDTVACCSLDQMSRAQSQSGCGCGPKRATSATTPPEAERPRAAPSKACCS
ncbi:FAD-dependent oxidoreductase [Hydrogenophaga sp. BPS33]|uniref:FAD-dependent oxidoreductase n=1 Tax=Hydrogenophaga sp. BPS33 TaxID=2651974 RepID=UPI00131FB308|nr:FAD-dependent oxidoreductase [Hydrogenophaga sp. BPS33]QHE89111.1 NAD(P)-binding protein [Hydrogenophaga sp. BPS33]